MCSRKGVGPRIDPWEVPALSGYSFEEFPSRITQSHLLLRKEEIRPNIWPKIPKDLSLWNLAKPCMPNLVKSLGYIKCCSSSSPRPI